MNEHVALAFTLTALAGLSTGIGSALAFFSRRTNRSFLSASLGFSAGVMIYVSLIEIFAEARYALTGVHGEIVGTWVTAGAFFGGMLIAAFIDQMVPSYENPHEARPIEQMQRSTVQETRLLRMGMLTAMAIGFTTFPKVSPRSSVHSQSQGLASPSPLQLPSTTSLKGSPFRYPSISPPAAERRPSGFHSSPGSPSRLERL